MLLISNLLFLKKNSILTFLNLLKKKLRKLRLQPKSYLLLQLKIDLLRLEKVFLLLQ